MIYKRNTFSVAPMMDWTNRHYRYFARCLSRHALLYTEMVTTGALLFGDTARFLRYHEQEHPLALQLGGSDPSDLAKCSRLAEQWGYDEVNLNVGCPSDRVQNNRIGACLMADPETVARCIAAMQNATGLPVTIKHRLGINGRESYAQLCDFVGQVAATGCKTFIVHARIAILEGLSPKENREIPPLRYDWAYRLKTDFPDLEIILNGGIQNLRDAKTHLMQLDGVMVGREAYHNPWILADVDAQLFGCTGPYDAQDPTARHAALQAMRPFIEAELAAGTPLNHISRHLLGLFHAQPGGRLFRRYLSEQAHKPNAGIDTLFNALEQVTLAQGYAADNIHAFKM